MRLRVVKALVVAGTCVGVGLTAPLAVAAAPSQSFDSFSELRAEVLNIMGGSTKRIWLTTDYLTDGEIVTALYVAQYRKVDVRVLLGRAKATNYMSRLNYLKNQNIPVYLRPDSFRRKAPSALLCDDSLLEIDGELDFMTKYKHFTMTLGDAGAAQAYAQGFAAAAALQLPALARPLPLVGRQRGPWPGANGQAYSPPGAASSPGNTSYSGKSGSVSTLPRYTPHYDQSDSSSAYTYDRRPMPRPDGVPTKLPKGLKYQIEQQRQQQAAEQQQREQQAPAAPTVVTPLVSPGASAAPATPTIDSLIKTPVLKEDTEQGGD